MTQSAAAYVVNELLKEFEKCRKEEKPLIVYKKVVNTNTKSASKSFKPEFFNRREIICQCPELIAPWGISNARDIFNAKEDKYTIGFNLDSSSKLYEMLSYMDKYNYDYVCANSELFFEGVKKTPEIVKEFFVPMISIPKKDGYKETFKVKILFNDFDHLTSLNPDYNKKNEKGRKINARFFTFNVQTNGPIVEEDLNFKKPDNSWDFSFGSWNVKGMRCIPVIKYTGMLWGMGKLYSQWKLEKIKVFIDSNATNKDNFREDDETEENQTQTQVPPTPTTTPTQTTTTPPIPPIQGNDNGNVDDEVSEIRDAERD